MLVKAFGVFSNNAEVKKNNRRCEYALLNAERFAWAASLLTDRLYPAEAKSFYTKAKKLVSDHEIMLDVQTKNSWRLLNMTGDFGANPHILRSRALELIENKKYAEAENIYHEMIELNFELPGTLCHLARVQLLSGREKEAEKTITKAWKIRNMALRYVVPRIIFLRILLLMTKKKDP